MLLEKLVIKNGMKIKIQRIKNQSLEIKSWRININNPQNLETNDLTICLSSIISEIVYYIFQHLFTLFDISSEKEG
jgi:hypothetical protein